jgi:hypothetical protein
VKLRFEKGQGEGEFNPGANSDTGLPEGGGLPSGTAGLLADLLGGRAIKPKNRKKKQRQGGLPGEFVPLNSEWLRVELV